MKRKDFIKLLAAAPLTLSAMNLPEFNKLVSQLPKQGKKLPVLFTSHGNPMDIPMSREQRPFWNTLFKLGKDLQTHYEVKAVVVVSAHWCTKGTYVNMSGEQKQIYDYYGFPKEYYEVKYQAKGAPEMAHEIKKLIPTITETNEWGLDHGAWPMLMHLFPEGNVPVFQLSIDYHAKPEYHYNLGKQLKSLREKGVLIIGSGSLIHNLQLAGKTILEHTLACFLDHAQLRAVVVSLAVDDPYWPGLECVQDPRIHRADGGAERADSVLSGLQRLSELGAQANDWVLVHDAARPNLARSDLDLLLAELAHDPVGGLLAVPARDTLKRAGADGRVQNTVDRSTIWQAFTPQMFRLGELQRALADALLAGVAITDEASAMEWAGQSPRLIEGRSDNLKVTRPEDLLSLNRLWQGRS